MKVEKKNRENRIKGLQRKLLQLRKKYERITKELGNDVSNSNSNEEAIDTHQLLDERALVSEYIERLENQVHEEKTMRQTRQDYTLISVGNIVFLQNSDHSLRVRLVEERFTQAKAEVSIKSPIGKMVIGKRVGESISVLTPRGTIKYTIKSIE